MSHLYIFQAHGRRVALRVDDPALLPLAGRLHSCARVSADSCAPSSAADLVWESDLEGSLRIGLFGEPWETGLDADSVFLQSENLLTQIFSERHADALQLHAGAVVSPDGSGWLIAGESGSGKTSLTLAMILEGWRWLSDELILVERERPGELVGVPRNFNIKQPSFGHFPETRDLPSRFEIPSPKRQCLVRFIDPGELAPNACAPSANLEAILFPKFTPDLKVPAMITCRGADFSGRLLGAVTRSPSWGIRWVIDTVEKIPAWEVCYSDPRLAGRFLAASPGIATHAF